MMASRQGRADVAAARMMEGLSVGGDGDGGSEVAGPSRLAYLTPIQQSLVYELTTRRKEIADAQSEVDFWREHDSRQEDDDEIDGETRRRHRRTDRFGKEVIDAAFLDDLISQRRAKIAELRQMNALKEAIVHSADAAHSINASMAAVAPASYSQQADSPLCVHSELKKDRQPLRSLVARRDELALHFLKLDERIKALRNERKRLAQLIDAMRGQTSTLVRDIEGHKDTLDRQRNEQRQKMSKPGRKADKEAQKRIEELHEAILSTRSKRMMIKGVLRGILLESGIDWTADAGSTSLMLSLADDEQYTSDEEDVDLFLNDDDEGESEPKT